MELNGLVVMRFLITLFLLVFPLMAQSAVYRWVDENGQVHFGSVPPKQQSVYKSGDEADDHKLPQKIINRPKQKPATVEDVDKNKKSRQEKSIKNNSKEKSMDEAGSAKPLKTNDEERTNNRVIELENIIKELRKREASDLLKKQSAEKQKTVIKDVQAEKELIPSESNQQQMVDEKEIEQNTPDENQKLIRGSEELEESEDFYESIKNSAEDSNSVEKDSAKCGFFASYVDTYEYRIKYECPASHCDVLNQQLEKYRKKMKSYCEESELEEMLAQ